MSESGGGTPAARAQTMFVIFGAFVMATFIYAVIIVMGLLESEGESLIFSLPAWILLGALSLWSVAISVFMGARLKPKIENTPAEHLIQLQTRMIIQCAAFESIAIYGLVFQIFGVSKSVGLLACGAAFAGLISLLPGLRDSLDTIKRLEQGDPGESLRRPMGGER